MEELLRKKPSLPSRTQLLAQNNPSLSFFWSS
jgi:hypothetical protein